MVPSYDQKTKNLATKKQRLLQCERRAVHNIFWSQHLGQNLDIYTVFYQESESEAKKCKILEPGGKRKTQKSAGNLLKPFFKRA